MSQSRCGIARWLVATMAARYSQPLVACLQGLQLWETAGAAATQMLPSVMDQFSPLVVWDHVAAL